MYPESAAAASCPPALQAFLRYASRMADFAGGADAWLCHFFGVARQQDWPVAPFSCLEDGLDPGNDYWFRADPVHFHLQRDSFTVADGIPFVLDLPQAQELVNALNVHFADEGMRFFAPCPTRWYFCLNAAPLLETFPLQEVKGQDAGRLLPRGRDALRWHARMNEMQMLLHEHPVNQELGKRGELPVNGLWIWGGGVLPRPLKQSQTDVWADDALARGLAAAHGVSLAALPESAREWLEGDLKPSSQLIVLDQLEQAHLRGGSVGWHEALKRLELDWFQPLLDALHRGGLASVSLHLAGPRIVTGFFQARQHQWKFWRRPRHLGAYLG